MADISIDERGFSEAVKRLVASGADMAKSRLRCHQQIGKLVKRTAVDYAPKSPTRTEKAKTRKTKGKTWRKARAYATPNPGGLMRSISWEASEDRAAIFIAGNSEAAKYAKKIHDEKGRSWKRRGPGTVAKGPQADEKFIERAVANHRSNGDIVRIIDAETKRCLKIR